jgi:hypothetical protein
MTPTTAAVMPVSGAVNFRLPCVDSMNGAPIRMKKNDGRKVKNVTTVAATAPESKSESVPKMAWVQPPTKPTKDTTMMSGPGVVSPSASPSIIWVGVSQWKVSTAPW